MGANTGCVDPLTYYPDGLGYHPLLAGAPKRVSTFKLAEDLLKLH